MVDEFILTSFNDIYYLVTFICKLPLLKDPNNFFCKFLSDFLLSILMYLLD